MRLPVMFFILAVLILNIKRSAGEAYQALPIH